MLKPAITCDVCGNAVTNFLGGRGYQKAILCSACRKAKRNAPKVEVSDDWMARDAARIAEVKAKREG